METNPHPAPPARRPGPQEPLVPPQTVDEPDIAPDDDSDEQEEDHGPRDDAGNGIQRLGSAAPFHPNLEVTSMPKKSPVSRPTVDAGAAQAEGSRSSAPASVPNPDREEQIRQGAYERFLRRGDGPGDAQTDWLDAEADVDARQAQ